MSKKIETLVAAIVAAFGIRATAAPHQAAFWSTRAKDTTAHKVGALLDAQVDVRALADALAVSDKADARFVAKYAAEKVLKLADALAQGSLMRADRYTQSILLNARRLEALSARGALVALSRQIEWAETDAQQEIKRYGSCEPTTASTQRSSTREALRVLNVGTITKGKRDDAITFADSEIARRIAALADAVLSR